MGELWFKDSSVTVPEGVTVPDCMRARMVRALEHTTIAHYRIEQAMLRADEVERDMVQSFLNACGVAGRFTQMDDRGVADWVDGVGVGSGIDVTWYARSWIEYPVLRVSTAEFKTVPETPAMDEPPEPDAMAAE